MTVALRGTYEDGKWTCTVTSDNETFEYKALIGDWNEGETVEAVFEGLTELGRINVLYDYNTMVSGIYSYSGKDIKYGDAVYFKRDSNPYAVRGQYVDFKHLGYKIILIKSWYYNFGYNILCHDNDTVAYVGSYELGEKLSPVFANLTWEPGENHIYK